MVWYLESPLSVCAGRRGLGSPVRPTDVRRLGRHL